MNIIEAVESNNLEFIKNNIGKFNPNQNGEYNFPLLHRAVYWGYLEIIQLLINNGADINILDEDSFTPLHSIIEGNQNNWFPCIELLLKNNAKVNTELCWQESNHKESPLITAVRNEVHIEIIKLLIEYGADINYKDSDNDNAIRYANDLRLNDIFKLLEEKGAIYDGKITREEQLLRNMATDTVINIGKIVMRYTKEQTFSISKLMVEALYREKTVDEAMEQVFSKEVGMYRNFKQNVKDLEKLLNGGTVHLATSCNLAEAHYFHLKGSDKIKFLDAMNKQIEYYSTYGTPSHKLKKWVDTQKEL